MIDGANLECCTSDDNFIPDGGTHTLALALPTGWSKRNQETWKFVTCIYMTEDLCSYYSYSFS